jgi:hypothetical protein
MGADRAAFAAGFAAGPSARNRPPVGRLHHLFDASPIGLAQQGEHALLLGNSLDLWFVTFGGTLAVVAASRAVALDLTLLFLDAAVLKFRDFAMEWVDICRLRWFAAPDLTLARPQAPQIAGRAPRIGKTGAQKF